jgi:peptide/nickel transport system permease protein
MSIAPIAVPGRLRTLRVGTLRKRYGRRVALISGIVLLTLIVVSCIVVPLISPYGVDELVAAPFQGPSRAHPFGTDSVGRDVLTRVFAGGRIDLFVAGFATAFSLILGTLVGTLSGLSRRRWIDSLISHVVDAVIAFPVVVLILSLVVLIGPARSIGPMPPGLPATLLSFLIVGWTFYARLARGQALALRDRDYVVAGRLLGYSQRRIIRRHVAPTVIRVNAAYAVGDAIAVVIVVGSLAFLGAGVQAPAAEWGSIMFEGRAFLETSWWISVFPGLALVVTGLSLSLVADALLAGSDGAHR